MAPKSHIRDCNEKMSPHKTLIALLIQEYFNLQSAEEMPNEEKEFDFLPKYRKRFCMLLLKLIQYPDMSYKQLHDHLKSSQFGLHPTHLQNFERSISSLVTKDVDSMYELSKSLESLVEPDTSKPAPIGQYGIVGLYLRRILVTLDSMSLIELMQLYRMICNYYNKSIRAVVLSTGDVNEMKDLSTEIDNKLDNNRAFRRWNRKQMELFVGQQFKYLENNDKKALPPLKLQQLVNEINEDNPNYSPAYFLNYMNCLRLQDFYNSIDSLHRSFDLNNPKNLTCRSGRGYQYLSINQTMFHAKFGHTQSALNCLKESIMLAQEARDQVCLQLAESWLKFLNPNSASFSNPTISQESPNKNHSLNLMLYAKSATMCGFHPNTVMESVTQSDFINCQNSLIPMMANSSALKAAILAQFGNFELSSLVSQLLLSVNLKSFGKTFNGEALCHVLSNIALWISLLGEYAKSAVILQYAKMNFSNDPLARIWNQADQQIVINQAVLQRNWSEGFEACSKMKNLDKEGSLLNLATIHFVKGNHNYALELMNGLLSPKLNPLNEIKVSLLKIQLFISSTRNLSEAFGQVIKLLGLTKELNFQYETALCQYLAAHLLLDLGMPGQAIMYCRKSLSGILEQGGSYDRAKVKFLFVKCLLASMNNNREKVRCMQEEGLPILLDAISLLNQLESFWKVKQIFVFIAEFYHKLGMNEERNKYAYRFRQLEEDFPSPYEFVDGIY